MLQFLTQILLFIYLILFRKKQRVKTVNAITCNTRKTRHIAEIPEIPSALDNVTELPREWRDTISFIGFNIDGLTARIEVDRYHNGASVLVDLDIPGLGQFSYKENKRDRNNHRIDHDNLCWSQKVRIRALQPMRRWRIYFRGSLDSANNSRKRVHAVVSFYWQCLSDPYDFIATPSCWNLAKRLSSLAWKDIRSVCLNNNVWYQQWGEIRGTINIEGCEDLEIRLKSVRERLFKSPFSTLFKPICSQYLLLEDSGHAFCNNLANFNNEKNLHFGFSTFPIGDSHPIELQILSSQLDRNTSYALAFPQTVNICQMHYQIVEKMKRSCFNSGSEKSSYVYKTLTVNGKPAYGIQRSTDQAMIENASEEQETIDDNMIAENLDVDSGALIIDLDQAACKQRNLVGGKACQLSTLRFLKEFNVPKGFCLTVNALREHVSENKELKNATENIKIYMKKLQVHNLKLACNDAVKVFRDKPLSEELQRSIRSHLESVFGIENWLHQKFAIRSSGLGEDSIDSSSAGQMDTLLCIQGFENIVDAVQHCWASSVSYQVVDYRRQNGQNLIESMGVVIQEMVDADVAGVLFTIDPITGNESKMIINATFGLGESVVAGKVSPDSFIIKRTEDKNLRIEAINVEEKLIRITSHNETGTTLENNYDTDKNRLCLKENDVFRICQQGLQIENDLNRAQDIEWAISKGILYILQARPITTFGMDADEEIIHEFDSPVVSNNMLLTTANIQEMMPGAVSTLTSDLFVAAIERSLKYASHKRLGIKFPVHAATSAFTFSGIPMLNLTPLAATAINHIGGEKSKSNVEIFVVGQTVKEHTLEMIRNHYGRQMSICKRVGNILSDLLVKKKATSKLFDYFENISDSFSIGESTQTAKAQYDSIDEKLFDYFEMWRVYTGRSSSWSSIIMAILKGESEDMSIDNLTDMASILSQCKDVYSAEVPLAIKRLAKLIATSDIRDQFMDIPAEECDSLLKKSGNKQITTEFLRFMERQGHRGIREAEFLEKPWSQDPSDLMKTLQMIIKQVKFEESTKPNKTIDEIVENLKTPLSRFKKMLLKFFLVEKALKGVRNRELGKSVTIRFANSFKQAYWRLANFMVRESRLPDTKLLFFLTHAEIGELLERRSANLVRLAKRRMRVYPKMNETKFPKINIGLPAPIKKENQKVISALSILQGMPVCRGKAKGRACVIKSLEDAHQIEEGDVLVCRYTDVGWTPYFPLISGLVTELGGLLSHGAVVARECGIPCLVNTPDATDLVRTGDIVFLDGTTGTFGKLAV